VKVLHLTASPFFGGPERVILDIVQSQIEYGFDIESEIASFRENGHCEQFIVEIHKLGLVGHIIEHDFPNFFGALFDVIKLLRTREIDVVCAHGHKSRFLGWLASRRLGIPIVGVSHGWTWQDLKTSFYERFDQWVHHRLDKIICVSQGQAEKVIKTGTNPSRVFVIHNAIDLERFDIISGLSDKSKNSEKENDNIYLQNLVNFFDLKPKVLIGAAGRLSPEKGYDILIDAIKILVDNESLNKVEKKIYQDENSSLGEVEVEDKDKNENYKNNESEIIFGVVLFGEGFMRSELQRRIDNAGISDRIKMVGFTPELYKYLHHFDIFVQSSRTEGFPCINLEAMASGVPVIATQVGGVPEQIESGYDGILVPAEDSQALADAMRCLIQDSIKRKRLGLSARQTVQTKFKRTELAQKYFNIFQSLTNKNVTVK
jgi:glycosyltransferase involved in cell wall biosynthesis